MTEPPLTHARVWRIALPLVLSNATVPLVGLVDTAVVGQLGQAAPIGAVAIGAEFATKIRHSERRYVVFNAFFFR